MHSELKANVIADPSLSLVVPGLRDQSGRLASQAQPAGKLNRIPALSTWNPEVLDKRADNPRPPQESPQTTRQAHASMAPMGHPSTPP
jgi:hypothetical protein